MGRWVTTAGWLPPRALRGRGQPLWREVPLLQGGGGQQSMKVKVAQSCLTLCDPMDCTVHGILQARILEWVAFPFSRGSFQTRD